MNMVGLRAVCLALPLLLVGCTGAPSARSLEEHSAVNPPIRHVFVIVLENEPYEVTFSEQSLAPYLAHELPKQGALLQDYYAIGHDSLDNYIAMIGGQAPNIATQYDCHVYAEFVRTRPGLDANGQALGEGCIYPADVKTLPDQLEHAGLTWRGYMQDMGADPAREAANCGHVAIGALDATNHATPSDEYANKHDPFVYFHSIIDDPARCSAHVVNLDHLEGDLANIATTPNYAYIVPGLCHDGHDAPCKNGERGGLISANAFLRTWVPKILAAPAFKRDGLLIVTFDEGTDAEACCGEQPLPGGPAPGMFGPGGGRIGTVLVSPFIKPGTVSAQEYNHYSQLRSIEDLFDLPHLGYAGAVQLKAFGKDVYTSIGH
ncbi:MAG: alkaline phosphatase family protein, partial [Rudaea sp.]